MNYKDNFRETCFSFLTAMTVTITYVFHCFIVTTLIVIYVLNLICSTRRRQDRLPLIALYRKDPGIQILSYSVVPPTVITDLIVSADLCATGRGRSVD